MQTFKMSLSVRLYVTVILTCISLTYGNIELCRGDLPTTYEVSETTRTMKTILLCGKPTMPLISYKVGKYYGDKMNGELVNSTIGLYNYTFILPRFPRSYCCRNMSMIVYGSNNSIIEHTIKLKMKADPPVTSRVRMYPVTNCAVVLWKRNPIGQCLVQYKVELSENNNIIKVFTTTHSEIKICNFKQNAKVRIWSIFDERRGNYSEYINIYKKVEVKKNSIMKSTNLKIIIGMAGVLALLMIFAAILYVKCNCISKRKQGKKAFKLIDENANDNGQEKHLSNEPNIYYNFPKINTVNVRRVHTKSSDLKKQVYTDLNELTGGKDIYTDLELRNSFNADITDRETYVDIFEMAKKMGYESDIVEENSYDDVMQKLSNDQDSRNYLIKDSFNKSKIEFLDDNKGVSYIDVKEDINNDTATDDAYNDVRMDAYDDVRENPFNKFSLNTFNDTTKYGEKESTSDYDDVRDDLNSDVKKNSLTKVNINAPKDIDAYIHMDENYDDYDDVREDLSSDVKENSLTEVKPNASKDIDSYIHVEESSDDYDDVRDNSNNDVKGNVDNIDGYIHMDENSDDYDDVRDNLSNDVKENSVPGLKLIAAKNTDNGAKLEMRNYIGTLNATKVIDKPKVPLYEVLPSEIL